MQPSRTVTWFDPVASLRLGWALPIATASTRTDLHLIGFVLILLFCNLVSSRASQYCNSIHIDQAWSPLVACTRGSKAMQLAHRHTAWRQCRHSSSPCSSSHNLVYSYLHICVGQLHHNSSSRQRYSSSRSRLVCQVREPSPLPVPLNDAAPLNPSSLMQLNACQSTHAGSN